jgi:hypothetical protein
MSVFVLVEIAAAEAEELVLAAAGVLLWRNRAWENNY